MNLAEPLRPCALAIASLEPRTVGPEIPLRIDWLVNLRQVMNAY